VREKEREGERERQREIESERMCAHVRGLGSFCQKNLGAFDGTRIFCTVGAAWLGRRLTKP
jgi:hypothetical protein